MVIVGASKVVVTTVIACVTVIFHTIAVTPTALLAHANSYNGQHVKVAGWVEQVEIKKSQSGDDYEVFNLCDKACVRVFTWGHPVLISGKSLSVVGKFVNVEDAEPGRFHDEIEVDRGAL